MSRAAPKTIAPDTGQKAWLIGWALGWGVVLLVAAPLAGESWIQATLAISGALAPAVLSLILGEARPRLQMVVWAIFAWWAAAFGGGASGPLAVLCLSPLAFALMRGGARRLAEGAALSLAAVFALAVMDLAGMASIPLSPAGVIGPLAMTALALGFGAALAMGHARNSAEARVLKARIGALEGALDEVTSQAAQGRTREEEAQEGRRRAEAEAAGRSRFLAAMSHELRTPLNAIIGFSDIMRQRLFGPLSDRYSEYAQLIHESGQHLLDLIGDVLDISKIDADRYELSREVFDAREAVQAALRLLRPQSDAAGVALAADLGAETLEIDADRRAVKQIVINLVANALKFTPKGGSITVTTQIIGDMLDLAVSDTGVGISPADLERLGKPFEQAGDLTSRRQGTGLGLSLVRAFATLHGGDMSLESVLGEGTTVTVRLPLPASEPLAAPPVEPGGNVVRFSPR